MRRLSSGLLRVRHDSQLDVWAAKPVDNEATNRCAVYDGRGGTQAQRHHRASCPTCPKVPWRVCQTQQTAIGGSFMWAPSESYEGWHGPTCCHKDYSGPTLGISMAVLLAGKAPCPPSPAPQPIELTNPRRSRKAPVRVRDAALRARWWGD
jgi:hypothetical protein